MIGLLVMSSNCLFEKFFLSLSQRVALQTFEFEKEPITMSGSSSEAPKTTQWGNGLGLILLKMYVLRSLTCMVGN